MRAALVLAKDLIAALMLLTRLPVARLAAPYDPARVAGCVWAFPIVGMVVGALGSLAYAVAHWSGVPPPLAAAWTIAALMLLTGALHEDGLADTVDGFGGGATRARKLEIMRDSRIGSYGALALIACLAIRITALASLAEPGPVAKGLILAGILGRSGMLVLVLVLDPARGDGLASELGQRTYWPPGVAFGVAATACLLCLTWVQAAAILAMTGVVCLALANLARFQVGGYTGDILGACETVVECVAVSAFVPILK